MTGFRSRLCTADSILDLVSDIEHNRNNRRHTLAVFFDVSKAFDSVGPTSVILQLTQMGLTGSVQKFIWNMLHKRTMQVRLGTTISTPRKSARGLPQGSVLSPLLFNIVMAGLPKAIPKFATKINISLYADDICIWTSGDNIKQKW